VKCSPAIDAPADKIDAVLAHVPPTRTTKVEAWTFRTQPRP
jgi:hypothetical protein